MAIDDREHAFWEQLLAAPGPAGFEADAQQVVRGFLAEAVPDARVQIDRNANLVATVRPEARPHVALLAHVDTVGLIVHEIDANGILRVGMIGRPDAEALVGQRVTVRTAGGAVPGVVFRLKAGDRKAEVGDLAVDCGFADADAAGRRVHVGDCISCARPPVPLDGRRAAGPATDDRAGVFAICLALRRAAERGAADAPRVTAASVIMEEGPTHMGAIGTMSRLRPDLVLCVDTTHADDHTGGRRMRLGGGPAVARGGAVHGPTSDALIELAGQAGIPYQIEPIGRGTGTDLEAALQFAGGEAIGALVSIPHRHYHGPNEVIDLADVEHTIELLARFVCALPDVL
jgi:endoglucanase